MDRTSPARPDVSRGRSSSWEDVDDDEELQRHRENLDNFGATIRTFLDGLLDNALAGATAGRLALAPLNARLKAIASEMTATQPRPAATIAGTSAATRRKFAADVTRSVTALEASVDALFTRTASELYVPRPSLGTGSPAAWSIPGNAVADRPPSSATDDRDGRRSRLPAFLAALEPYDRPNRKWCRGCDAPASAVPAHWSDSFHRTLHRLWSAVPPASAFAAARGARTVAWTASHRILAMEAGRHDGNGGPMSALRKYVDAELGVSETGVRRHERPAYLWTTAARRRPGGPIVAGYTEVELVTTGAFALDPDGQLLPPDGRRRPVVYGVCRLWVAVGHRRRRVATGMLDAFRADRSLRGRDIAFAPHEIQFGDAFVRHYSSAAAAAANDPEGAGDPAVLIYTSSAAWYCG